MNESSFLYAIWLVRSQRRETPAVIGQKFLDTLDALSSSDPLFTHWKVFDFVAMKAIPLADARSHMAAIVENNVMRDSYDQPTPKSGYGVIGVTENAKKSRIVKLRPTPARYFLEARSRLRLGVRLPRPTRRS